MTIGATTTFTESRDEIISEALEACGAIGPGDVRDATNSNMFLAGERALNRVAKSVGASGVHLWNYVRRTTTTTAGVDNFVCVGDVLALDGPIRYTRAGATSSLQGLPMSRDNYMELADRTTPGPSTQYYVEQQLNTTTVFLWPVPDATGDTIEYTACIRTADFTAGSDTPDFWSEWTTCLVYGLIVELAPKFSQSSLIDRFKPMFEAELRKLCDSDNERLGMTLVPWGAYGSGGGAG